MQTLFSGVNGRQRCGELLSAREPADFFFQRAHQQGLQSHAQEPCTPSSQATVGGEVGAVGPYGGPHFRHALAFMGAGVATVAVLRHLL